VGDVLVVDIGGATTDVYSVLEPGEDAGSEVVGTLWRGRTVEGDLGMRWSAPDVVAAAERERLPVGATLAVAARQRHDDVGFLPGSPAEGAQDVALASLAAVIAVRRHARPGAEGGRDLSRVGVLIGSGGVLRHAPASADEVLGAVLGDLAGGWRLPERAAVLVDTGFLLAPIGLLALRGEPVRARAVADALLESLPSAPH
jgi:uncharacterized protein (TIGR01319 family)